MAQPAVWPGETLPTNAGMVKVTALASFNWSEKGAGSPPPAPYRLASNRLLLRVSPHQLTEPDTTKNDCPGQDAAFIDFLLDSAHGTRYLVFVDVAPRR